VLVHADISNDGPAVLWKVGDVASAVAPGSWPEPKRPDTVAASVPKQVPMVASAAL